MKTATFVWSVTIQVSDDFGQADTLEAMQEQVTQAKHHAYLNLQASDGALTDVEQDSPTGPKFSDLIELVIE